jgi:hypothetical protein
MVSIPDGLHRPFSLEELTLFRKGMPVSIPDGESELIPNKQAVF